MTYSLILRRTLLAASAAALCLPAMAELADIKSAGKLRVGIDFGAPFYGYVDDKMKPVGSDVEAAELLAKDLGLQLEIVNTTNSARIPNLLSNKVDLIISSLSITPDRQKAVDFSIPYGAIQAAVGAPKSMKLTGEVLRVIESLAEGGMTMVLVTHEMEFAARVADTIIYMHEGKVWETGPGDMLKNPQTAELKDFLSHGL